eukprot:Ihof_evm4s121 gene=Ihof_evmTU4s121
MMSSEVEEDPQGTNKYGEWNQVEIVEEPEFIVQGSSFQAFSKSTSIYRKDLLCSILPDDSIN